LIACYGIVLAIAAGSHHVTEVFRIGELRGPAVAFAVDGLPALALVYGGYLLSNGEFRPANDWRVFRATLVGSAVIGGATVVSILVRSSEGRVVSEPPFQVLLGLTAGALAGFLAGYYSARSLERAYDAAQAQSTLEFTNGLLRHDIKNDMTVIRGHARHIAETGAAEPGIAEAARTIDGQVDKVLSVIQSTGAISETFADDPEYKPVDLAAVAEDTVDSLDGALYGSVTADLPDEATVLANEAVGSIVRNVVKNGIEHNDADDPAVHVTVDSDADAIRLRVLDNGPGIPPAQRRDIFAPRTDGADRGGLYVVKTLVDNYGGEITIEDNEPRGTAFIVDLPRV
jgi:hypothetical protein